MIKVVKNKGLFENKAQCFVNPANAIGWMGGWLGKTFRSSGIAEAIQYETKGTVEKEAKRHCRRKMVRRGDLFVTTASPLPYENIIHLVTVQFPGWRSSQKVVESCVKKLVCYCEENQVKDCVLTGIGTGVGGVNHEFVARLYLQYLQSSNTVFYVTDKDENFLKSIEKGL